MKVVKKKKIYKVRKDSRSIENNTENASLPELIHKINPWKSVQEIEQEIEDALDRIENDTAFFYSLDEFHELLKKEGLI